ncbi:CHAT domain-containing protein [Streptomyces sp. enrichment culture]|uniref:CHAT domain-containing protein n=1 Tax=Streptomyces sp. enrichment culture TaxID=1795815 RepID=UPI003F54B0C9
MPEIAYDLNALMWEVRQAWERGSDENRDVGRVSALVCARLGCATAGEAYDRLYRDWRALPPGTVLSGMRAGQILALLPMLQLDQASAVSERGAQRDELMRAHREYGPSDPSWQAGIAGAHAMTGLRDPAAGPADLEAALARVEQSMAMLPPDAPSHVALRVTHAGLRAHLAQLGGGEDDFDSAVDDLGRLADSPVLNAAQRLSLAAQLASYRARQAALRQDEEGLAAYIAEMDDLLARLSPGHADRPALQSNADLLRTRLAALRHARTGRFDPAGLPTDTARPVDEVRRQLAELPRDARADRLGEAALARIGPATLVRDTARIGEGVALLHEAMEQLAPDDERWARYALALGGAHVTLAALGGVPAAERSALLDQGIAWLVHVRRQAGGPAHPLWHNVTQLLARAYRVRGDARRFDRRVARLNHEASRRTGLDGVRTSARGVLLQSGTAHAAANGRQAGAHAREVARWCLADGAYEDAVRALDAGRGLVLHAATVAVTVPDMLEGLGEHGLAEEWRVAAGGDAAAGGGSGVAGTVGGDTAAGGGFGVAGTVGGDTAAGSGSGAVAAGGSGPSSRLRRRVLDVLAASPHQRRLLEVPSLPETAAALRALGVDALVYLLPSEEREPGAAVVVAPDGSVRHVPLPELDPHAPEIAAYQAVGAPGRGAAVPARRAPGRGRDAGRPSWYVPPVPGAPAPDAARAALERLCDWAGRTVMEPLLKRLPRRLGGVPSLVLVPMAELGLVPWHAARVAGRRGRLRYACQDARVSYVPSARLLCEVAARPATARPGDAGRALVVGNPTHDLPHAGEEARAVHAEFHPGGLLLGPDEATPAAVADWLRRQRGGLLHLACHGVVRPGERHSAYLELAGGRLAAEELTEGTDRYAGLDLVLLAACRTGVSGHGYDEAYSLATAFLVAGARSVIGSLWPVPDEATSLLMYMTHHYMSREGRSPGQALRAAQSWMLDERREAPPGMPAALLPRVRRIDATDPTGWAGFTHLGW